MQVIDRTDDLSAVKAGPVLREDSLAFQVEVELASVDVFSDEAEAIGSREGVAERQQERVVDTLKQRTLRWKTV